MILLQQVVIFIGRVGELEFIVSDLNNLDPLLLDIPVLTEVIYIASTSDDAAVVLYNNDFLNSFSAVDAEILVDSLFTLARQKLTLEAVEVPNDVFPPKSIDPAVEDKEIALRLMLSNSRRVPHAFLFWWSLGPLL